ncbi:MAG TPA: MATE family efflux transporter, partial [Feifaniaceae bacterium]|nr:MATE family efflux transporter [Feifaniaceae bacterium]
MGVPLALSMLTQALYNIVDSIFVSFIDESALTAVTLSYPIFMLMISVAVGTGVGINSLISRRLGAKRFAEAELAASNGFFLMLFSSLLFVVFGLFFAKPFIAAYTSNPETAAYGADYLSIVSIFCVGLFMQVFCERIMQSQGKNLYAMLMQLVGAVVNIILDPILIFGLLGFPKLGVAGAAIATVIGQMTSMVFSLLVIFGKKNEVRLTFKGFKPDLASIKGIYEVGFPTIVLQAIGTVMTLALNAILIVFSETAVAVFGAYFKVQSIAYMPLFGTTNAAMSIIAYNYGACNKKRVMRTWKLTLIAGLVLMTVMAGVFLLLPDQILSMFNASADMLRIGKSALTIIPLGLPIAVVSVCCSMMFQAIGKGSFSMYISLARQLVLLVPVAWLLARLTREVTAVWWAFPIAEVLCVFLSVALFVSVYRSKIKPLASADPCECIPKEIVF